MNVSKYIFFPLLVKLKHTQYQVFNIHWMNTPDSKMMQGGNIKKSFHAMKKL